jgi:hypothetical protein
MLLFPLDLTNVVGQNKGLFLRSKESVAAKIVRYIWLQKMGRCAPSIPLLSILFPS